METEKRFEIRCVGRDKRAGILSNYTPDNDNYRKVVVEVKKADNSLVSVDGVIVEVKEGDVFRRISSFKPMEGTIVYDIVVSEKPNYGIFYEF